MNFDRELLGFENNLIEDIILACTPSRVIFEDDSVFAAQGEVSVELVGDINTGMIPESKVHYVLWAHLLI